MIYGYLSMIVSGVLISEVLLLLMPDGGFKKFTRIAVGIFLLIVLLFPLKSCKIEEEEGVFGEQEQSSFTQQKSYTDLIQDVYQKVLEHNN